MNSATDPGSPEPPLLPVVIIVLLIGGLLIVTGIKALAWVVKLLS